MFKKVIDNTLFQIVFAIVVCFFVYQHLPLDTVRAFFTLSSCLREILVAVLPFMIFAFIASALSSISKDGLLFILGLMGIVTISNFLSIMVSGAVGFSILSGLTTKTIVDNGINILPYFSLNIPFILDNTWALICGIVFGVVNSFWQNKIITKIITTLQSWVMIFMKRFFIPLLPLFIFGFFLKLFKEEKLEGFISQNPIIYLKIIGFLWGYLLLWLAVAASFKPKRMWEIFKNALPAILTAFSTMSSAAALPLSIEAAKKNTNDEVLADAVMPLTVNFHMIGDTIVIPIMSLLVLLGFNHPLPSVVQFVKFGSLFVINKFAGGGVPGGSIMITIPILQSCFNYDDNMVAFIIAFYGIMDPIATSGSVAGNNFFVIVFQKIKNWFNTVFEKK